MGNAAKLSPRENAPSRVAGSTKEERIRANAGAVKLRLVLLLAGAWLLVAVGTALWLGHSSPQPIASAPPEPTPTPVVVRSPVPPSPTPLPAPQASPTPEASPAPPSAPRFYYRRGGGRSTPTPSPTPSPTALVDEELNRLESGSLAFNAPDRMTLRKTYRVQLLIQPGSAAEELAGKITAPGPVVTGALSISKVMEAALSSGPAFTIDSAGAPRAQPVSATQPTEWDWLVTPVEPGPQQLHLTVNAVVTVEGIARSRVLATKDYTIDVQVAPAAATKVERPWLGWAWMIAVPVAVAVVGVWVWFRAHRRTAVHRLGEALRPEGAQAFVSYSRHDSAAVIDLVAELHARGLAVWLDTRNIEGGELWASAISTAIRDCRIVLLMASPASIGSAFVQKEIALATAHAKPVLAVLLRPCELPAEWELATAGVQWINASHRSKSETIEEILRALAHHGVTPAKSPA